MNNGFINQLSVGKVGEADFLEYCEQRSLIVQDVTMDKYYQSIDVDFIVNGYFTSKT